MNSSIDALSRICPQCGEPAEYPDCANCGHDFTAGAPAARVTWSRGRDRYDAAPVRRYAANFEAFLDAIESDRGTRKHQQWVAADFGIAPDDELHRQNFPSSIGKPHRCKACALPRRWLGLDVDGGLTSESFSALVQVCQRWNGVCYTTASHTPADPHCRVVVELDAEADDATGRTATAGLRALIDAELAAQGHPAPKWDANCDKSCQPLYLPVTTSQVYRLEGEPAALVELLAHAPRAQEPKAATASAADAAPAPAAISSNDDLVAALLAGENLHDSTLKLTMRLVDDGVKPPKAAAWVRSLMTAMPNKGDMTRWRARYNDIPRLADGAAAKLGAARKPAKEYKLLTGAEVAAMPPLEWRIKGVFPARGIAHMYGGSTAAKTFLGFDAGAAIAGDRDRWFGYRVHHAPVTYVVLEGEGGFPQRVAAWCKHNGRPLPDRLRIVMQPLRITDVADVSALSAAIDATLPRGGVVFVDTQNASAPTADENASSDMGAILEGAKRLAAETEGLVVLVAHTGKDPTRGARGHSSQLPAMDAAILVARPEGGDRTQRVWEAVKVKDGRDGGKHNFTLQEVELGLDEDGDPVTSCVVVPGGEPEPLFTPIPPGQALAIEAYTAACKDGRGCVDGTGAFVGLHLTEWRTAFYAAHTGDSQGAKQKAFQRARHDLQRANRITVRDDVYRVTVPHVTILEPVFIQAATPGGQRTDNGHVPDMSHDTQADRQDTPP